ncbi:MAG TPA: translation elongation factor Ts [Nannocystis exedens]|nr:translation elongation factor Ts [Nannocystis exedens]
MAKVSAADIKTLRARTGSGLLECKKALVECDSDIDKAIAYLRKKGLAAASKKAGRLASEGLVVSYIHSNNRVGVLLEVNCETDFVSVTDDFRGFCNDIAMQIAAMNPLVVSREEVDDDLIAKEREIYRAKALADGKPEKIVDRIVDGQVNKFYSERCLLEQKFVKDDKKTVETLLKELIAKIGENVKIRRFTRYELGDGLEKKSENFAEEVAAQRRA